MEAPWKELYIDSVVWVGIPIFSMRAEDAARLDLQHVNWAPIDRHFDIYYLRRGGYDFASVCLSVSSSNSKRCRRILITLFGGAGRVINGNCLDSGADQGHDSDPGIIYRNC